MTWLAIDTRSSNETMLAMPRLPPTGPAGIGNWLLQARRAARLDHPDIAAVAECGVHEHWPFVAVDRRAGVTLEEWLAEHPAPSVEDAAALDRAASCAASPSLTTPASRTSTCSATTCSSTSAARPA